MSGTVDSNRIRDIYAGEGTAPLRILIADDQERNRKLAANLLKIIGYCPAVAGNGSEAVNEWEHGDFDLILMDLHMPLVNGIEATCIIRSHERDRGDYTPIIACSADYAQEPPEKYSCLGFDGFVRKPLHFETLRQKIQHCIQLKRPRPA
jgi:two-component system sensor histidine kinase/response regulator